MDAERGGFVRKIRKVEPSAPSPPKRKRVAAYARVSVDTERLMHSLSAQVSYYSELIQSNPEWEYAGVYADYGVSGTSTAHRGELQRLLADCEAGMIDIILTKSISRFARNTLDLLEAVRHLKELGVEVRFEKENISSLSGDGELMLSILASFAQEESRSLSENVKWSIRKKFEAGIPNGHFRIFGYRWDGDHLVVQPEEAAVVRRIYQNFLDGKSRLETERELAAEGITTLNGCRWEGSSIKTVLTNITYTGNLLFQKEYVIDPITQKKVVNRGELPQYYVEESHEAIIDKATFDYVQAEMARRRELGCFANKHLNLSCFSTKVKCTNCGRSFVRSARNGGRYVLWTCGSKKGRGKVSCGAKDIPENQLMRVCNEVLGLAEFQPETFSERVRRVEVIGKDAMRFCFMDGSVEDIHWHTDAYQKFWTPERRAAHSAFMKAENAKRREVQSHGKAGDHNSGDG